MIVWVAPSEPSGFKNAIDREMQGARLKVSALPERYGCDVLWTRRGEWWGIQRKTVSDFVASVQDGRLAKELGQMGDLNRYNALVVIEGSIRFHNGKLMLGKFGPEVTAQQWQGMVWSVGYRGVAVDYAADMDATAVKVARRVAWSERDRSRGLRTRPAAAGKWGTPTNREYGEWLLQGLPGVGPELASRIWEKFGGVPWLWQVTEEQLTEIEGIGKVKAKQLIGAMARGEKEGIGVEGAKQLLRMFNERSA